MNEMHERTGERRGAGTPAAPLRLLLSGAIEVDKPKKRCSISRNKLGPEGVEPLLAGHVPIDNNACADHGKPQRPKAAALRSRKQQTPTTTPPGA
jgi:hypothetical protein